MTASSRPDMTIEQIAERYRGAVAQRDELVSVLREWVGVLSPDARESSLLARSRAVGITVKEVDKAAFTVSAWEGQLRPSLNGAFIRGDLTEDECRAYLPDWEPSAQVLRAR